METDGARRKFGMMVFWFRFIVNKMVVLYCLLGGTFIWTISVDSVIMMSVTFIYVLPLALITLMVARCRGDFLRFGMTAGT